MVRLEDFVPGLGKPFVRRRIDKVFSRKMLGAVFVGTAATQATEKTVVVAFAGEVSKQLLAWVGVFVASVVAFVWWDRIERRTELAADEATEEMAETVNDVTESVSADE
ncbi:hypothetical protein [Halomicrococcus sp. NG-SE-24]|uniref:hypothetical protein n=1 Tax=Halomicrococcus sp. NG-SE-24 TaxID=3436928 RepID=UPI003D97173F